jgi:CcmD family protein
MKKIISITFTVLFLLTASTLRAQQEVGMADTLRSEGKIYVVVAIMVVVFTGIAAYLFLLDRKVTRLEKRIPGK